MHPDSSIAASAAPEVVERRASPRHDFPGQVVITDKQLGQVRAVVRDISLGGCFVETRAALELHSDLELLFWLGATEFSMRGTIRRKIEGTGVGVQFAQPEPRAD